MYFRSAEIFCNHDLESNCTVTVYNDTAGGSYLNSTTELRKEVPGVKVSSTIKLKSEGSTTFDTVIWTNAIDTCNIQKGIIGSFLAKFMVEQLHKYSNYPFECPQHGGFFYVKAFPLKTIADYFPRSLVGAFINGKSLEADIVCVVKVKVEKSKPLVPLIKWKILVGLEL